MMALFSARALHFVSSFFSSLSLSLHFIVFVSETLSDRLSELSARTERKMGATSINHYDDFYLLVEMNCIILLCDRFGNCGYDDAEKKTRTEPTTVFNFSSCAKQGNKR